MSTPQLLILPGSLRSGSLNQKLAMFASERAQAAGCRTRLFDLRALALPLYDGDLEANSGVPQSTLQLQQAILESDGLILVSPEYNGFPSPLVLNTFNWLSRIASSEGRPSGLAVTTNKPAALLSASPGPGGALRAMNFLRQYLQMAFAMLVVPQQFALGVAHQAFDEQGMLKDDRATQSVDAVVQALTTLVQAMRTVAR